MVRQFRVSINTMADWDIDFYIDAVDAEAAKDQARERIQALGTTVAKITAVDIAQEQADLAAAPTVVPPQVQAVVDAAVAAALAEREQNPGGA